jgi:hypothetical protein
MKYLIVGIFVLLARASGMDAKEGPRNIGPAPATEKGNLSKPNGQIKAGDPKKSAPDYHPAPSCEECFNSYTIEEPHRQAKGNNSEKPPHDLLYQAYLWATVIGVGGGLIGLVVLIFQAKSTKIAAEAALKQTLALRDFERPWIDADIEPLPETVEDVETVLVVFRNHGRTVAKITKMCIEVIHNASIQDILARGFVIHYEDINEILVPPGGKTVRDVKVTPWENDDPFSYNSKPSHMWIKGGVVYADSVTPYSENKPREHLTNFCYACATPVIRSFQGAQFVTKSIETMKKVFVFGFRKTGPFPLNKYI